jgi:hypothetical protein
LKVPAIKFDLRNVLFMGNELIPVNIKGKPNDLEFSVTLDSIDQARHCYMRGVKRMQNPNIWHDLAGWASASFKLVGTEGEELLRLASEGDYIRIDLPGPGPAKGNGPMIYRLHEQPIKTHN